MRSTLTTLVLSLSAFSLGCGVELEGDAMDELLVSALSGEEDSISGENGARMAASASGGSSADAGGPEGGDRSAPPPMFRECDAEGSFVGFVDAYDTDASGALEDMEQADVEAEHAGPRGGPREHFLHLLRVVYDSDMSHSFEDAELDAIFDDFSARCEAIHATVLATYDADGDGALSAEEEAEARAGHHAQMEAERAEMEACRPEGGPEGGERGRGPEGGPESGERGEDSVPFGPLEQEFDADGSGDLSADELANLRSTLQARIRSGARPQPDCAG